MSSLGEALPELIVEVKEILREYESIPEGAFGAVLIKESLRKAEEANRLQDVELMMIAYQDLEGIE